MNKKVTVSIVIPTYNHAHFLPRVLSSVYSQTWTSWEVLLIDNNSTDNTDEVLKPWLSDRVRLLKVSNYGAIAVSRNKGIKEASGEWVAFLDSDDWWTKNKLEITMRYAQCGADVLYHDLNIVSIDSHLRFWRRSKSRSLAKSAYEDMVSNGCALPNSSVVVKKAKLEAIGGLCEDPDLIGWEDFDTWLRLAKNGCSFIQVPGSHGYYWKGVGSVSNPKRTLANIDAFLVRHVSRNNNIPWWCSYSRAVAYNALKNKALVKENFVAAWRVCSDPINCLRIVCKWLVLRC
jgi:teichuronic acid biosynthesis glycosyltransferase TuaG